MRLERKQPPAKDDNELSPRMKELILSFDAKRPLKKRQRRDAKGRFVASTQPLQSAPRSPGA